MLSHFLQRSGSKKIDFKAKNTKILYCSQFLLTNTNLLDLSFLALNVFSLLY